GPGSNKSSLCQKAARQTPGWAHVSIGRLLRQAAEQAPDPRQGGDAHLVRHAISNGEMVLPAYVIQLLESALNANARAQGIIVDGFPRDMSQVLDFESRFKQQPPVLLLDCSKLQLGRGRLDDTVAAFRRRLELFRELTLPMLRTMDQENRLTIVDGDTDSKQVQDEFYRAVQGHMESLRLSPGGGGGPGLQGVLPRAEMQFDTMLHDLEAEDEPPGPPVVANGPRRTGGARPIANGVALGVNSHALHGPAGGANNGSLFGGAVNPPGRTRVPVHVLNGGYPQPRPSRDTIRHMYADVEAYPVDSHM
ncbi:adenylate kinase, partial [Frankliniella occidentalis]|uniref:Adenylate kinase n=1 Tax=Frankliniella occidentalis TaxID=133901 RepID=A0A9C6XAZ1_FRAOC